MSSWTYATFEPPSSSVHGVARRRRLVDHAADGGAAREDVVEAVEQRARHRRVALDDCQRVGINVLWQQFCEGAEHVGVWSDGLTQLPPGLRSPRRG